MTPRSNWSGRLPKFAKAATDEELGAAFEHHLDQTKEQVERLERVFGILGEKPKSKPCKGMRGPLSITAPVNQRTSGGAASNIVKIGVR